MKKMNSTTWIAHPRTCAAAWLCLGSFLGLSTAYADGHYVPGVEGIQAASVPPPGLYYVGYLVNYDIRSFRAPGTSENLPGRNKGRVTALANRVAWISNTKFLGADYGMEAIVPIQHTSLTINAANIDDSRTELGDIYLGPLVLGWHGQQWDAVAAAGIWLDNGSTSHPASAGKGFKSTMLTGGATYYFDQAKTVSASGLMRFERNSKNDAGLRPGNQMTFEWGVGKLFNGFQAGVVGYSQLQLSNDKGIGASDAKSSRHALGLEVVYPIANTKTALKGAIYNEFKAKAGTGPQSRGTLFRMTLVQAF